MKSRSAARPGVISSPPLHDPHGRVTWQSISDGGNSLSRLAARRRGRSRRARSSRRPAYLGCVLWNPASSNAQFEWKAVRDSAGLAPRLTFSLHEARTPEELEKILPTVSQSAPDMLFVLNDPFMFTYRKRIVDSALQSRLPAIYGFREYAVDGGLITMEHAFRIPTGAQPFTWTRSSKGQNRATFLWIYQPSLSSSSI